VATGWNNQVIGSPKPIQPVAVTTSVQTIYTAPANSSNIQNGFATAELKGLTITNTTSSAINVNIYIVPSGGTAGTGNAWAYNVPVGAYDTKPVHGLQEVLAAGDTIQVSASATGLTIRGSVVEVQ
jgi:hypothetical protein